MKQFPTGFLWGASTASHQVEGNMHNQWSEWELKNADRLAKNAPDRLSWLSTLDRIRAQATNPENYISGSGIEHYERYRDDFRLLKQLNMNAFRFGIEWSRIEPREGVWDQTAIEHYRAYIQELKDQNIEPIVTLWHWTMPVWFAEKGGFERHKNIRYFDRFIKKVAEELGNELSYVITLNEPNVYVTFSYVTGEWPPQRKSKLAAIRTYVHLLQAHHRAYKILKMRNTNLRIGIAQNFSCNLPFNKGKFLDRTVAAFNNYAWNWWFFNRIKRYQDFVGFNFYHVNYWSSYHLKNPENPKNDVDWYMEPIRIKELLVWTHRRYQKPILITENGVADAADIYRQWWIEQTLLGLESAMDEGVELTGYLHWSLLDNFEWAYGWWPKFGLISVDRSTMTRHIRPSASWFAKKIGTYSKK